MSWGCQGHFRRTQSTFSILSSAPAQHLEFLYPRWFGSTAIQSPRVLEPLTHEHEANTDGAKGYTNGEELSLLGVRASDNIPQLFRENQRSSLNKSAPRKNTYDWGYQKAYAKIQDQVRQVHTVGIAENTIAIPTQVIGEEKRAGLAMRTLEDTLRGKDSAAQSSFLVKESGIRRYGLLRRVSCDYERGKPAFSVQNTDLDQWDWRIPLQDLKRYYKSEQDPEAEENHEEESRPAPSLRTTRYTDTRVQDIPRPETWTEESLASYTADLTRSRVARSAHRRLYQGVENHRDAVRNQLVEIFSQPSLQPLLSVTALNTALTFLLHHHRIDAVRQLFNIAARIHIRLTPASFNMMLRAAARRRDLSNFGFILGLMISRSVAPNQSTWTAFLSLLGTRAQKLQVLHIMRALGMLAHRHTFAGVIVQFMPAEVDVYLGPTIRLSHFIDHLMKRYGDAWISIYAVNIIVKHLAKQGRPDDVLSLLGLARSHNCEPAHLSLHTFLANCSAHTTLSSLTNFIARCYTELSISPSSKALDLLFRFAWRHHAYNTAKVTWRVVALRGATSYTMQSLALTSLLRNTPRTPTTRTTIWDKEAGKVLVGAEFDDATASSSECRAHADLITRLSCYAEPEARPRTRRLAELLVARDLDANRFYRLGGNLITALAQAARLDEQWEKEGRTDVPDVAWKIANSVNVPVVALGHASAGTRGGEKGRLGKGARSGTFRKVRTLRIRRGRAFESEGWEKSIGETGKWAEAQGGREGKEKKKEDTYQTEEEGEDEEEQ